MGDEIYDFNDFNDMSLSYDIPRVGCSKEAYESLKEAARRNNDVLKALEKRHLNERRHLRNRSGKRGITGR